jgi:hypothetical protein
MFRNKVNKSIFEKRDHTLKVKLRAHKDREFTSSCL